MKAILVEDPGERSRLVWREVPDPVLKEQHVLIKIFATAVNRADLLQRKGLYPPPPGESDILGLEMAGEVIDPHGSQWKKGNRVMALLGGGGYAEKVVVHRDMLLPVPENLSLEQAAAIPEVFYTAFVNLFLEAGLEKGESILIHAGGSGVGTAAIQLARWKGCEVFITAGSDEKIEKCKQLGANDGIQYHRESFSEKIRILTGEKGVDVILDCVGGKYLEENLSVIARKGRIVQIAALGGAKTHIDLGRLLQKRVRLIGSTLRGRSREEKVQITNRFRTEIFPLLERGEIHPVIDSVIPIQNAEEVHQKLHQNLNFGKIVLRIS